MATESTKPATLKQRAAREMEEYLVVALFLFALLGALTAYRRILMSEVGLSYLHYGYAAVQALVLAKIILIGEVLHLGERFQGKPLIVSALYKSIFFGVLALLAHALEHVIRALVEGGSPVAALGRLAAQRAEIGAYALVLFVAFVPFFSLQEAGRSLGEERFLSVLMRRPPARNPSS
jgi:hypothetical protein